MNKVICIIAAAAAMTCLSVPAIADDTGSDRPIKTHQQKMKECLSKERRASPNVSDADRKKTCGAKIDSFDQHPSETLKPPDNPAP
jgi:hypothetical protein